MTEMIDDNCQTVYDLMQEIENLAEEVGSIETAEEFVDSVLNKARSITQSVEEGEEDSKQASEAQINAMENIRNGLEKWIN